MQLIIKVSSEPKLLYQAERTFTDEKKALSYLRKVRKNWKGCELIGKLIVTITCN